MLLCWGFGSFGVYKRSFKSNWGSDEQIERETSGACGKLHSNSVIAINYPGAWSLSEVGPDLPR